MKFTKEEADAMLAEGLRRMEYLKSLPNEVDIHTAFLNGAETEAEAIEMARKAQTN